MKKPLLGALGVAGACAACCTLPLAIPFITAASVAGFASFGGAQALQTGYGVVAIGAGAGASLLVGLGLWGFRRRKAAACRPAVAAPLMMAAESSPCVTSCACPTAAASGAKS